MQFQCPQCKRDLEAPDGIFAKEGICRFCGAEIVSPSAKGVRAALKQSTPPDSFGAPSSTGRTGDTIVPEPANSLAKTSLLLGILGVLSCGLTGIAGLVCGIIAMRQTRGRKDHSTAIAGTVISAFTVLVIGPPLLAPVFLAGPNRPTTHTTAEVCLSNCSQLGRAMIMYMDDNDGRYPPAAKWNARLKRYAASPFIYSCPSMPRGAWPYKMNSAMGSAEWSRMMYPMSTVILFDARSGGKPFGGANDVVARHGSTGHETATFAFADGHASVQEPSQLAESAWKPRLQSHRPLKTPK
ncbi:MAG TPA: DUF4190 domain-containing protein [Armatimonadota bacterium]|jgi:prepilin-type processing-associated H-X9-DG protein